jgi:effector-binding domain-containing protein
MIRFVELLIALLIVVVLFVLVGAILPSSRYIEHTLETNRPLRQVYDTINGFHRAADWHPLRAHDPRIEFQYEGEERGEGARLVYHSRNPRIGTGSLEVTESEQDERVVYAAENDRLGESKRHIITLNERGKTIEIRWGYHVDYGWNLFGRYAGMYVQRTVGDDIRVGLGNLVGLLATMPNFDYKSLEIGLVEVQPANILYSSQESERNITAVENALVDALAALNKAAKDNKLEVTGPARLITTNFGSDKYEFDVALPVRDPNAVAAAAGEPSSVAPAQPAEPQFDEDGNPLPPAAPEAAPALPLLEGLRLPDGIEQAVGYGGRALRAEYVGHPAALPLVRDMLRSYAASHGYTIHNRAFEEYLSDIADTAAEDAAFNVYWPVEG